MMVVKGKYRSVYEPEKLWAALLSAKAIRYAVPEIDELEPVSTHDPSDENLVWRGTGTLSGVGTGAATIIASDLKPFVEYTLEFQCRIGSIDVNVKAKIHLILDEQPGTFVVWNASIVNAATGQAETMFEWTAGLMAQHFFKRIDHYLSTQLTDQVGVQQRPPSKKSTALPDRTT
jgi:hypothetical protein